MKVVICFLASSLAKRRRVKIDSHVLVHDSGTSENPLQFQIPKMPSNKKISKTQSPEIYADEISQRDARLNETFHRTMFQSLLKPSSQVDLLD